MRWRTYSPQFRDIVVPVPPFNKQVQIAGYLDDFCHKMDEEISTLHDDIRRLEELKTTLISDVVTGKIDVRDVEIPEYEFVDEDADADSDSDDDSDDTEEQEE